ncbi:MAG: NERD domain-containing protein [Bacillus sp. (in: Bacteria)]|nr:NERD domain-containing protein [Bacillus sp. (in: firmicutes)]
MIILPLKMPLIINQLEALIPRLHPNHPKLPEIEYDLNKRRRGYRGERSLLYHLSIIDDTDVYIFHNLRTKVKDCHFETDTLILTKEFFLIFLSQKTIKQKN